MDILIAIFVIATLAFDIVIFIEIEHILDNTLELGVISRKTNRYLIRKKK